MTFHDIKNDSDREFTDISGEARRLYILNLLDEDDRPYQISYEIESPIALSTHKRKGTGHYVIDASGDVHRVPFSPLRDIIRWTPKQGAPHVQA